MRAAKLAAARQKLRDHQEKKQSIVPKEIDKINLPQDVHTERKHENQSNGTEYVTEVNNLEIGKSDNAFHQETILALPDEQKIEFDVHLNEMSQKVHANEILVMDNRKLEAQAGNLHNTITMLEMQLTKSLNDYETAKKYIQSLETDFKSMKNDQTRIYSVLKSKDDLVEELSQLNKSLNEKQNEISEQLDFTKTALIAKQNENAALQNQLTNLQSQLDIMQLHLQQLTNGNELTSITDSTNVEELAEQNRVLIQKVTNLERKLKIIENEHDHRVTHYEQYVNQLNEQLKDVLSKNSMLSLENDTLANREISLVSQLSDMEKQLQSLRAGHENFKTTNSKQEELMEVQNKCLSLEESLNTLKSDYGRVQNDFKEATNKIEFLTRELHHAQNINDNLDISKLNADITSDKIAAQRAITQNQKLKKEIEDLHEAYVKMSKDKLELVEKLDAEKFLNRELTLKLAEVEDKSSDLMPKLIAKDNEMIRLQAHCSEMEKEVADQKQQLNELTQKISVYRSELANAQETIMLLNTKLSKLENVESTNNAGSSHNSQSDLNNINCEHKIRANDHSHNDLTMLSIEEAMLKLQDRFLNKMNEVADLSDEKQKLEHLVMQLQNETDTICEYVALYQQQRGILRKREEERNEQIKFFEGERERMRAQLEGLANIITRLGEDKELQRFLQDDSKKEDIYKIRQLITNIKNNHFMNPNKQYIELEAFHPCAWCSGKLIDV